MKPLYKLMQFILSLLLLLFQSCPTLCDPIDSSPPGSPIPGIVQARALEWVAISFSTAWKWKVKGKSLSHVRLLATPWTAAYQAPLSMGFSRQEDWSGVPSPSTHTLHIHTYHILFDCLELSSVISSFVKFGSFRGIFLKWGLRVKCGKLRRKNINDVLLWCEEAVTLLGRM